ncbi:hypothetical protein BDR26DRAFT_865448 [Obelidium mucronatum]|nr:hypothetical protein BDR26DRAFT_865448 [Obelidium mucronatum]
MFAAVVTAYTSAPPADTPLEKINQLSDIISTVRIQPSLSTDDVFKACSLIVNKLLPPISASGCYNLTEAIAEFLWKLHGLIDGHDNSLNAYSHRRQRLAALVSALPLSLDTDTETRHSSPDNVECFTVRDVSWEAHELTGFWGMLVGKLTRQILHDLQPLEAPRPSSSRQILDNPQLQEAAPPRPPPSEIHVQKPSEFMHSVFRAFENNNGFVRHDSDVHFGRLWTNTWGLFLQGFFNGFDELECDRTLEIARLLVEIATIKDLETGSERVCWNLVANLTGNLATVYKARYLAETGKARLSLDDQDGDTFGTFLKFVIEFLSHSSSNISDQSVMIVPLLKGGVDQLSPASAGKLVASVWKAVKGYEDIRELLGTVVEEYGWEPYSDELTAFIEAIYDVWGNRRLDIALDFICFKE